MTRLKIGHCELCQRHCDLTFHHLIPRKLHRRKSFRKRYSADRLNEGINICRLCHTGLHKFYDELTLAKQFCTLNALRQDPVIAKHISWVSRQRVRPPV